MTDTSRETTRDHHIIASGGGPEVERKLESYWHL